MMEAAVCGTARSGHGTGAGATGQRARSAEPCLVTAEPSQLPAARRHRPVERWDGAAAWFHRSAADITRQSCPPTTTPFSPPRSEISQSPARSRTTRYTAKRNNRRETTMTRNFHQPPGVLVPQRGHRPVWSGKISPQHLQHLMRIGVQLGKKGSIALHRAATTARCDCAPHSAPIR
jgi:hypothetical protein